MPGKASHENDDRLTNCVVAAAVRTLIKHRLKYRQQLAYGFLQNKKFWLNISNQWKGGKLLLLTARISVGGQKCERYPDPTFHTYLPPQQVQTLPCWSTAAKAAASMLLRTTSFLSARPLSTKNLANSVTSGGDSRGASWVSAKATPDRGSHVSIGFSTILPRLSTLAGIIWNKDKI